MVPPGRHARRRGYGISLVGFGLCVLLSLRVAGGVATPEANHERMTREPLLDASEARRTFRPTVSGEIGGVSSGQYLVRSQPFIGALSYRSAEDENIYYVEGDGRHVVAMTCDGVLLWREDPFAQAELEPYRFDHPRIVWIGEASQGPVDDRRGDFIAISYDSTQFGLIDTATGEFIFQGQD